MAAVLVVLALAGLAAYAVFSPPTTVPVTAGSQAAPAQTAPTGQGEQESRGGEHGD